MDRVGTDGNLNVANFLSCAILWNLDVISHGYLHPNENLLWSSIPSPCLSTDQGGILAPRRYAFQPLWLISSSLEGLVQVTDTESEVHGNGSPSNDTGSPWLSSSTELPARQGSRC